MSKLVDISKKAQRLLKKNPKSSYVSIGWEMEFDAIQKKTGDSSAWDGARHVPPLPTGFGYQEDGTVGTEIRSPPFRLMSSYIPTLNNFWSIWKRNFPKLVPALIGATPTHNSIGFHHHVGLMLPDTMDETLNFGEKMRIAEHIYNFYPFLSSICLNSPASEAASARLMYGGYAGQVVKDPRRGYLGRDHHHEINESNDTGTIEVRRFDSNIPQVTLTTSYLLKVLARGALEGVAPIKPFDNDYAKEMDNATASGFGTVDPKPYFNALLDNYPKQMLDVAQEEGGIPASVREVLYLAGKGMSIADLNCVLEIYEKWGGGSTTKMWDYFNQMTQDAGILFPHYQALGYKLPKSVIGQVNFSTEELTKQIDDYVPPIKGKTAETLLFLNTLVEHNADLDSAINKLMKAGFSKETAKEKLNSLLAIKKAKSFKDMKSQVKDVSVDHLARLSKSIRPDLTNDLPIETRTMGLVNNTVIEFIVKAMNTYSNYPVSADDLTPKKLLESKKTFLVGYEPRKTGTMLGYIAFSKFGHKVHDLVVLPKYRDHYIATQLMESAFSSMRMTGADAVTVHVKDTDVRFMRSLGFREISGSEKKENMTKMSRKVEEPFTSGKISFEDEESEYGNYNTEND